MSEEIHPKLRQSICRLDGNWEPDEFEEKIVWLAAYHLSHKDDGDDFYCEDISLDDCLSEGSNMLNDYYERAKISSAYGTLTPEDKNKLIEKMGGLPVPLDFNQALDVLARWGKGLYGKHNFPPAIADRLVWMPDYPHKLGFKTPSGKTVKVYDFRTHDHPTHWMGFMPYRELAVEDVLIKKGVEFRFVVYDLPRWFVDDSGVTTDQEMEAGYKAAQAHAEERFDSYLKCKLKFPDQVGLSDKYFGSQQVEVRGVTKFGEPFLVYTGTPLVRFHSTNPEYKEKEIYLLEYPENPGEYVLAEIDMPDNPKEEMQRLWATDRFKLEKVTANDLERLIAKKMGEKSL